MSEEGAAPVRAGELLAGKYLVERVLGVGGMGVVVAATHQQLDQRVALKFLLPQAMANPEVVARFAREARAAAKIQSEHVARVIDVGTLPDTGSPYMVMEYLEGRDLAEALRERGALPVEEAVGYVLEACEALAEAHAAGIVHRDLKPANLFLARRPGRGDVVKVLDFGISKMKASSTSDDPGLTKTATLMGSPLYMSPEQMMSAKAVDPRSDIWAIGVILYELLTGQPPFNGDTVPEIVTRILHVPHPPIGQARADLPPGLQAVVDRCLEKEPAARFASVAELARALAPHASARAASTSVERISRVLGLESVRPPSTTRDGAAAHGAAQPGHTAPGRTAPLAMTDASWGTTSAGLPSPRSPVPLVLLGIVGVAAIGLGVWLLFLRTPQTSAKATRATDTVATDTVATESKTNEPAVAPSRTKAPEPPAPVETLTKPASGTASITNTSASTALVPTVKPPPPLPPTAKGTGSVKVPPPASATTTVAPPPPPPPPTATTKKNPLDMDPK